MITSLSAAATGLAATGRPPRTFRVARTATISAPAERIFHLINDFRQWPLWSPFERLDPNMKRSVSEPSAGTGATYAWDGNRKAGRGRMEIVDSVPPRQVVLRLDFEKPFKSSNVTTFTIESHGSSSQVTWAMEGPHSLFSRIMCLFTSMDRMIGPDFDRGLANLKDAAEQ